MTSAECFRFTEIRNGSGKVTLTPYLLLRLTHQESQLEVSGLLDTGASINVMPYHLGQQLGARWENLSASIQLSGNLARLPSRILVVTATVAQFPPVRLVFAWTKNDNVPLILGQVNFFMEFDVCFYRSQERFEMSPKKDCS